MAAKDLMKRNPTWSRWAGWLGRDPKPGTIYKDVVDMMAAGQIWEGFNAIVGLAPEEARKYGTFAVASEGGELSTTIALPPIDDSNLIHGLEALGRGANGGNRILVNWFAMKPTCEGSASV
jgi:hypothetical protein